MKTKLFENSTKEAFMQDGKYIVVEKENDLTLVFDNFNDFEDYIKTL